MAGNSPKRTAVTTSPATQPIAVVEQEPLRRIGLEAILSQSGKWQVIMGDAASLLRHQEVQLWLVGNVAADVPALDEVAVWKRLRPELKILVIGAGTQDVDVLRALSAGAKGYVQETVGSEELLAALDVVAQGSVWAPRRVLSQLIEVVLQRPQGKQQAEVTITSREREVLELLVEGRSNKEIAAVLKIEERTVKAHVAKLLRKVGAPNRIALTMHAIHHAMLDGPAPQA